MQNIGNKLQGRYIRAVRNSSIANGLAGNIMDPRVCTTIPTVKEALTEFIKQAK